MRLRRKHVATPERRGERERRLEVPASPSYAKLMAWSRRLIVAFGVIYGWTLFLFLPWSPNLVWDGSHEATLPFAFLLVASATVAALSAVALRKLARFIDREVKEEGFKDHLTGVASRAFLVQRLDQLLGGSRRGNKRVAVLFVDMDRFKVVNDSMGHTAGDEVLIWLSEKLRACLRPTDTLARFGGDEFVILMDDLLDASEATSLADRLIWSMNQPVQIEGRDLLLSISIGIALGQTGVHRPGDLLRYADIALYRAKAKGRARFEVFDLEAGSNAMEQLYLETDLRQAVAKDQLRLFYQPEFSVETGQIVGFEALLRWNHPTRGLLMPSHFVNLAEESGSLVAIGLWAIEEACQQLKRWQALFPRRIPLEMSVNLSVRQLQEEDFARKVAEILAATGTAPSSLRLEITESMVVQDDGEARALLSELKALGIGLAIDDFGTGYSSFSYLRSLPVDTVKIDQSFISGLEGDDAKLLIVQGIITLAHDLGLIVTAEGIETAGQLAALRGVNCDRGQGFHLAMPLPSDVAHALMEGHEKSIAAA